MPAMQHDQGSAALPEPGGGQGLHIAPPPRTADRMGGRSGGDAGTNGNGVEVRYNDGLQVAEKPRSDSPFRTTLLGESAAYVAKWVSDPGFSATCWKLAARNAASARTAECAGRQYSAAAASHLARLALDRYMHYA